MKQAFSSLMLVMLCAGMLTLAVKIQPVRAATITVPDDYKTIQDAVNHAHSGDTVYVRNGIYTEHVYINKTITLKGEGNEKTIIEAHKSNQSDFGAGGVSISSSNTVLENFRIVPPNSTVPLEIPTLVFIDGRVASCSNDTIRNCVFVFPNDVGAGSDAIDVFDSPNSTITGNKITIADPSDAGIAVIEGSVNCLVDNNSITGGWLGIAIDFADNNIVSNNYVADENNLYGGALYMAITSGDTVKTNVLVNNTLAIKLASSVYDSSIYHNNFKNNALQVYIDADSARIAWDNGYPSGGNYWSDYSGKDVFSGPYQNETGSDGIGDTAYVIDSTNADRYPLMNPWFRVPGDINGDGMVNLQDLVLLAKAYGSRPDDARWNPYADINGNDVVDLIDLVLMANHYGQHYP